MKFTHATIHTSGIVFLLGLTLIASVAMGAGQTDDFSANPGWTTSDLGASNFTYSSSTNYAGAATGEIGGYFERDGSSYFTGTETIHPASFDLRARGKINLATPSSGNCMVGYWNSATYSSGGSWHPADFVGLRTDEDDVYLCFVSDDSKTETAVATNITGGSSYAFVIDYDHNGGTNGYGKLTVKIGANSASINLTSTQRGNLEDMDRFGICAIDTGGSNSQVAYVDDIYFIAGEPTSSSAEDFDANPHWLVDDRGSSSIGYQTSNNAGWTAGEAGGIWYRDGSSYADASIDGLDPQSRQLVAAGHMKLDYISQGNVMVGWWCNATYDTGGSWHPRDFIGFRSDYNGGGHDVYLAYISDDSKTETFIKKVTDLADAVFDVYWDKDYGSYGRLTVTIDSTSQSYSPSSTEASAIADLDRFGMCNMDYTGSNNIGAYVDDVEYTSSMVVAPGIPAGMRFEDFDLFPIWTGFHNEVDAGYQSVTQNFGYKTSNYAGSASGEIGGVVTASLTKASYGMSTSKGLNDTLTCTGKFHVKDVYYNGGYTEQSWLWFGWFNSNYQGWQPTNFVGMGFPGYRDPDHTAVYAQFGTAQGVADRAQVDYQINENTSHTFSLTYDPSANDNKGAVALTIDGTYSTTCNLQSGFKAQGASLNMFGIFANNLASCKPCEIYFDDLVVNGTSYSFGSNPSWTGSGNNTTFNDYDQYGANNYGYSSNTNLAGGAGTGEIGGQWWNVHYLSDDFKGYYADTSIGASFGFSKALEATGKMSITKWDIDSGLHFGWFNSSEQGWPPKNFIGIHMDSITNNGRFFEAMYGTSSASSGSGNDCYYVPDGQSHSFTLRYDPDGGSGYGQVTFGWDGTTTSTVNLTSADRAEGATLNSFGVFNKQNENGKDNYVHFDDLLYTVNE